MSLDISSYKNGEISWELKKFKIVQETTGELGVAEFDQEFKFLPERIFFLRGMHQNVNRGHHSHKMLKQLLICLAGSFVLKLDNGFKKTEIKMTSNDNCLFLDGRVWREMHSFSKDCLILVLCDRKYNKDYVIREYDSFLKNLNEVNSE